MAKVESTGDKNQTATLAQILCVAGWTDEIHKQLIFISAINIFLSITAVLGNTLILVSLHKESSLHPPSKLLYRCLAATDLCVGLIVEPQYVAYLMSLVHEDWNLCRYTVTTTFIAGYVLSSVSLSTLTAISVDRLLALSLGLRYRQVVTLKRTYMIVIIFWVVSTVAGTLYLISRLVAFWCGLIAIPLCLAVATFSYTKIFLALRHNQVQQHQQHPSQPAPLNIARYRKAACSALWVQLALLVCYLPHSLALAGLPRGETPQSFYLLVLEYTHTLLNLNSLLNPFLYGWKITEVRQAVKETTRQALCCPWS